VYSFCNLHDVSWGTKGDNAAAALGGVTAKKDKDGNQTVEVEMITDLNDINRNYEGFIRRLGGPKPSEKTKRDAKTKMEDYFKTFRTRVVLLWVFTNAIIILIVTNDSLLGDIRRLFLISQAEDGSLPPGNPFLQVLLNPHLVYFLLSFRFDYRKISWINYLPFNLILRATIIETIKLCYFS
jgi:chitin synthase